MGKNMETTIMKNQMEKKMENEMETGIIMGSARGLVAYSGEPGGVTRPGMPRYECRLPQQTNQDRPTLAGAHWHLWAMATDMIMVVSMNRVPNTNSKTL